MIDRLPRNSAFYEALSDDDELAAQCAGAPAKDRGKPPRRRMSDWSPAVEMLTAVVDRLAEVTQAIAMLGGAKPRKLPRAPHPVTAFDRARSQQRMAKHRALAARVLPPKEPPAAPR